MKENIKKSAIMLTLVTLACKLIGFVKNIVLAKYWGTGSVVDAYVMVFAVGNIVFGWIGGFTGNFTPEYKRLLISSGRSKADDFANNLKNWLIIITAVFVVLFEVFAEEIIHIIAPGYSGEVYEITVLFWKIYAVSFFALILYRLYKEYINCNEKYVYASLPDLLMSSLCIVSIVASAYTQKEFLIWGYVVAIVLEAVIEKLIARKIGFRSKLKCTFDNSIKAIGVTVFPMFLSDTLVEINSFVDKMFASNLATGTMAILDYANNVKNIAYETGVIAIITIMYPRMSELWAKKDIDSFKNNIQKNIRLMCLLFLPVSFGFIVAGKYLIAFIYQRGAFTEVSTQHTTDALIMYAIGLTAVVMRLILNKVFCAMQMTRYVFVTSAVNVLVNIGMNFLLVDKLGMKGLALSTSVAAIIAMFIGIAILGVKLKMQYLHTMFAIIKMLCASIVMYGVISFMRHCFLDNIYWGSATFALQLLICLTVGVAVYAALLYLLKIDEIKFCIDYAKKKIWR